MGVRNTVEKLTGKLLKPVRAGDQKLAEAQMAAPPSIEVSSPAFRDGEPIPTRYSKKEGNNVSPPLRWRGVPDGTAELVLLCEDPDAPAPSAFVHWAVYHIPPSVNELPEGAHLGVEGKNSTQADGYMGPVPPKGHGAHHYHFQLFALDAPVRLGPHATRDELVKAMEGHVLAVGETVGLYQRN